MGNQMEIVRVNADNFAKAVDVYKASWQKSHRDICTPEFLENRDCAGYLQRKLGHLYMVSDGEPVGVFCLDGETFSDLYIHPDQQGKGYGTACVAYAKNLSKRLRLTVLSDNSDAIILYEKMGFCFTGNNRSLRQNLFECEMIYEN